MSRKRSCKDSGQSTEIIHGLIDKISPGIMGSVRASDPHNGFPEIDMEYTLSNRDIVRMSFISDSNDEMTRECELRWWVTLYIGPRKNRDVNVDGLQTGRVGLTGLHVAMQMIIYFILGFMKPGQSVFVAGADGRRFRVYKHYLSRMGFRQTRYMGEPAMMFTVPLDYKPSI